MTLHQRYPLPDPFAVHHLPVSDVHTLYVEEIGNPKGIPVIFLHGGPGVGTLPVYRQFFDPDAFHIILFSQRGANPSTPPGDVTDNDTWHLVEDIETLRKHFGISRWIVFGGSWGSTLALAYAIAHPQHTAALVLRGIFLGLQWEMDWLFKEGVSHVFPEAWQRFCSLIPAEERSDLVSAYHRRIFNPDPAVHLPAAWAWVTWEDSIGTLLPAAPTPFTDATALSMAKIECHYMINNLFFATDDFLLKNVHNLRDIPCHIVQGRYDMICPAESAFALAGELPNAKMHLVLDAGHASGEPGISSELIASMLELKEQFAKEDFHARS
jgi:proline iminopeptidase